MAKSNLTVKKIRKALEGLADDAEPDIVWKNGPPNDSAPGVEVADIRRNSKGGLEIVVDLFYLNEDDE